MGLCLETIVSRLSKKLDGRLAYSVDSNRTIGISEKHINIIRKGYNLPVTNMLLGKGLLLVTLPSLPKLPTFSILKLVDFLRKEPSVRWAWYRDSMFVHILQSLNLREVLANGDLS